MDFLEIGVVLRPILDLTHGAQTRLFPNKGNNPYLESWITARSINRCYSVSPINSWSFIPFYPGADIREEIL
jgi:hypothetical protein